MIAMGCVGCGAPLEIAPDMEHFACNYCGAVQRVERKGGTVALRKVEQAIHAVQRGTDKTAAELALVRLEKEHASLSKELEGAESTRTWKILIVAGGALCLLGLGGTQSTEL